MTKVKELLVKQEPDERLVVAIAYCGQKSEDRSDARACSFMEGVLIASR